MLIEKCVVFTTFAKTKVNDFKGIQGEIQSKIHH